MVERHSISMSYKVRDFVLASDYDALAADLAKLKDQDEVHWKTRRKLLAERDALAAELDQLKTALAADVLSAFMRNRELEAALRGMIKTVDWDDTVERAEAIDAANTALGTTAETEAKS